MYSTIETFDYYTEVLVFMRHCKNFYDRLEKKVNFTVYLVNDKHIGLLGLQYKVEMRVYV